MFTKPESNQERTYTKELHSYSIISRDVKSLCYGVVFVDDLHPGKAYEISCNLKQVWSQFDPLLCP